MDKLSKFVISRKIENHKIIYKEFSEAIEKLYSQSSEAAIYFIASNQAKLENSQLKINLLSGCFFAFFIQAIISFLAILFQKFLVGAAEQSSDIVSSCYVLLFLSVLCLVVLLMIMVYLLHDRKNERIKFEIQSKKLNSLLRENE